MWGDPILLDEGRWGLYNSYLAVRVPRVKSLRNPALQAERGRGWFPNGIVPRRPRFCRQRQLERRGIGLFPSKKVLCRGVCVKKEVFCKSGCGPIDEHAPSRLVSSHLL